MPSSIHETGYRRLEEAVAAAREALAQNDLAKLADIMKTHGKIMAGLEQAGECTDKDLLPMIVRIRDEVKAVAFELEQRGADLRKEMNIAANKSQIEKAYGG